MTACLSVCLSVYVVDSLGLLRSICQLCTFDLRKHVYFVCALHLNISTRLASHLDADASATERKFHKKRVVQLLAQLTSYIYIGV